jgi:hypothetical protein
MSDVLLIGALDARAVLPSREDLLREAREDLRDSLPNNIWQHLRLELTTQGQAMIEPFVGPVAVGAMARRKEKREHAAAIIESIATILFDAGVEPVVRLGPDGDAPPRPTRAMTMDEIVTMSAKATGAASYAIRARTFECRAEARLRKALQVGSEGDTASAYFRNYIVAAFSSRDAARVVGRDVRSDDATLVALHDVVEVSARNEDTTSKRGVLQREGRVFFPG